MPNRETTPYILQQIITGQGEANKMCQTYQDYGFNTLIYQRSEYLN